LRIAIDGPAGSGKSTVAKKLAEHLGFNYVDTGAMYRTVALFAMLMEIPVDDTKRLARLAKELDISFRQDSKQETVIVANGRDVSRDIRTLEVSRLVSAVAKVPEVRKYLTERQRALAAAGSVVMEGRDIGTVVLPDAEKKFFLTAAVEERARRRFLESEKGYNLSLQEHIDEIRSRDIQDATRNVAPLVPAPDAVVVDTTGRSPDQVVEILLKAVLGG
jgi:cytidylate kinase